MGKKDQRYEWVEPVASRIARLFIGWQIRITDALNKRAAVMSKQALKISLILFCVVGGGASLLIAGKGIFAKPTTKEVMRIDRIKVLPKMEETVGNHKEDQQKWEQELTQKIKIYQHLMDSLGESTSLGFQDSLQELENLIK
ncbi:MAG: hypothetical protein HYZ15_01410 [Sphingobacteriales bacterium]|nr:hypothetical protein [Sphingobacteriales bacterium]